MTFLERIAADNALLVMGGVIGVLVVASIVVQAMRRARPGSDFIELSNRIRSWWVMVIVFGLALLLNRAVSIVFFCFIKIRKTAHHAVSLNLQQDTRGCLLDFNRWQVPHGAISACFAPFLDGL